MDFARSVKQEKERTHTDDGATHPVEKTPSPLDNTGTIHSFSGLLAVPSEPAHHQRQFVNNRPTPTLPYPLTPTGDGSTAEGEIERLDANQFNVLKEFYARTAFPSTEEYNTLARQLDISQTNVQIWFQNKREATRQDYYRQPVNTNSYFQQPHTMTSSRAPCGDDSLKGLGFSANILGGTIKPPVTYPPTFFGHPQPHGMLTDITNPPATSEALISSLNPYSNMRSPAFQFQPPFQSQINNSTLANGTSTFQTKKRKRADPHQAKILNEVYARTAFPSIEERQSLARQLDLTPRNVQLWFQNKRQSLRQSNRLKDPILLQYSLKGAGLHSPERDPTPRCHLETRLNLRRNIETWLADEEREQDILWLFGPAGVGKSAVAQTIGELAEELGVLGAAVFFSRGRKTGDSSLFFTSVAFQLCKGRSSYTSLLVRVLQEKEFVVTNSDGRTQLKELLIKPFSNLIQNGEYSNKVLIIIDGLDECQGEDQQLDLVRLIVEAARDQGSSHFLWMIFSRLEHHLKELFYTDGLSDVCLRLDLLPQEEGAQDDIERYLRDGLERIAERYSSGRSSNIAWSVIHDPVNLNKLVRTASGTFVVASSLLGFIGDPIIADPISQMQIALDTIDGISVTSSSGNPLAPLDALYMGVLKEVGENIRPKTLQLLGSCAVAPPIPALHLANLIAFTEEDFYSALRILHAFLSVPHHTVATQESLHYFHASFPDFLSHHDRSGDYFQDPDLHRFELAKAFFQAVNSIDRDYSQHLSWLPPDGSQDEGENGAEGEGGVENESDADVESGSEGNARSESEDEAESESEDGIESESEDGVEGGGEGEGDDKTTLSDPESPLSVSHDIQGFAAAHIWELCTRLSKPQEWKPLLEMVANFDFRRLQRFCDTIPVQPFIRFVRWLHKLGKDEPKLKHIVRVDIQFGTDQKFLKKCTPIAQPVDLGSSVEVYDLDKSPRFAFAGFKKKSVVILFVPETVMMYSLDDVNYM